MNVTLWTKQAITSFCRVFLGTVAGASRFFYSSLLLIVACRNNRLSRRDYCDLLSALESYGYPSVYIFFQPIPDIQHSPRVQVSPFQPIRNQRWWLISFFEYRLSLISLSLFYSSLTKLFLLLLLTIWLPAPTSSKLENPLPEWTKHLQWAHSNGNLLTHVLETLDDDKLDREWVVRNVLGGMSAGFGLRGKFNCLNFWYPYYTKHAAFLFSFVVILGIHPIFTSIMILAGWISKTAVATFVSRWVSGNDSRTGEAWLAYSIS